MIVLEYYSQSLVLVQNSISETGIVKLCYQTLQALSYINSYGVVHRCLAPDNILFNSKGDVKLFNYGLYYMTGQGGDVSFPIGYVKFLCAEGVQECACDNFLLTIFNFLIFQAIPATLLPKCF